MIAITLGSIVQSLTHRPFSEEILLTAIFLSSNSMNSSTTCGGKTWLFSWRFPASPCKPICIFRVLGPSFTDINLHMIQAKQTKRNITTIRLQNEYWLITMEWILQHLYITVPLTLCDCKSENEFFLWCFSSIFFKTLQNGKTTGLAIWQCERALINN